ncbi:MULTISPECIES: PstS family phosphate ABC transporter substrate-binding protein [Candidatus Ichthyocystis]|uniref:Phosphate-binding protein n=1 Tax=Candidatus Ichthyocystis hellenicum TaxID=1561003 RepID=A0A0S4M3G9_9BURK|nr:MULTISPECIES: PstS family phosphate ABC transporter substrate-binding protein [Ichthyocystis]CUT17835.1 phosphate transport system substrate-binding protein [Candidatus Ichthyocystis hellenicum]
MAKKKGSPGISQFVAYMLLLMTTVFSLANASVSRKAMVIDGSATVYPITEAVVEAYQDSSAKASSQRIVISISGTGGGFQKFCRGDIDVVDASRPILKKEMEACRRKNISYVELPVAYDAISVAVNLKNLFVKSLSVSDLNKIWGESSDSKVLFWDQVNHNYPHISLNLYGPGPGSGTFDYFTSVVNGNSGSIRTDFSASQNDDVLVQGISRDPRGIAYFGYSYYVSNKDKIRLVPIDKGNGPVFPSMKSIVDGNYLLARPLFVYVSINSLKNYELMELMRYYLANAARFARESGYFELSDDLYTSLLKRLNGKFSGTLYGGDFAHSANLDCFLVK